MSPTGPQYGSSTAQSGSGVNWASLSNALVEDGSVATTGQVGPGAGGGVPNQLKVSGFNFNIPSVATIDGIVLEIKVSTTDAGGGSANDNQVGGGGGVFLLYNGGSTDYANTPDAGQFWPTSGLTWLTYGGSSDLWGKSWTPADVNHANFGASLAASTSHSTSSLNADSVRITVYYHIGALATNVNLPKRYLYKVYRGGQFLGCLPNVTTDFATSQDINTSGVQITVSCAVSADTAAQPNSVILDETGAAVTDENGDPIGDEGTPPVVDVGTSGALIRNGNHVVVWEYSYYWPQGIPVLQGTIENWQASYGGDGGDDEVTMIIYSDGSDMDEHVARPGNYSFTNDQSQTAQNANGTVRQGPVDKDITWQHYGQTFIVGGGVTNLGSITLLLKGTANVTINVYNSPTSLTLLGTVRQGVSVAGATAVRFTLPRRISVTAGNTYFFTVSVDNNQSITIYYDTANPYASGDMYSQSFSGGGGWGISSGNDLYFVTAASNGLTTGSYTSVDPTTGMVAPMMDDYIGEGGLISYDTADIQATGLTLSYQFNTNTVYEGLQGLLPLCPDGFYYYVDIGLNKLIFKQASTTADVVLIKGRHLNDIKIVATTEYVVNTEYVIGGTVAGSNIYTADQDQASIALYGQRIDRHSDSNILDTTTAHAVGSSDVAEQKAEQYQTVIQVLDKTMDITTLKLGMVVGFSGFGNFPDSLLAMIVHIDYTPEVATLTLGILPKRQQTEVEQLTRGLISQASVGNPTTPS